MTGKASPRARFDQALAARDLPAAREAALALPRPIALADALRLMLSMHDVGDVQAFRTSATRFVAVLAKRRGLEIAETARVAEALSGIAAHGAADYYSVDQLARLLDRHREGLATNQLQQWAKAHAWDP